METEKVQVSEDGAKYVRGFNDGYIIEKHNPGLAKMLDTEKNRETSYFQGFFDGRKEYMIEKTLDRDLPPWDIEEPGKDVEKEKPHDKDREPDRT